MCPVVTFLVHCTHCFSQIASFRFFIFFEFDDLLSIFPPAARHLFWFADPFVFDKVDIFPALVAFAALVICYFPHLQYFLPKDNIFF